MDKHGKEPTQETAATTPGSANPSWLNQFLEVLELVNRKLGNDSDIEAIINKLRSK